MTAYVWTPGCSEAVPMEDAVAPFAVPGVLFGETLFETLRARDGSLFRPEAHFARLQRGVRALGWSDGVPVEELIEGLGVLLAIDSLAAARDVRVRMTALRVDDVGGVQYFVQGMPYAPPAEESYRDGIDAIITSVRVDGHAPWTRHKTGQRLPFRLAKAAADEAGVEEGLLLNTDGMLADGTVANVHFVRDGRIFTPAHGCGALPGVTQAVLHELATARHIAWAYGSYTPEALQRADEAFLTNSLVGVRGLVRVDGNRIGTGRPGPVTRKLADAYAQCVAQESRPV